jgi:hypothetical protein
MDDTKVKTVVYILIISFVAALFGVAFMKLNNAAAAPTRPQTVDQKLNGLESSPGVTSPAAKNFIHNEYERRTGTEEAEKAASEGH